jgi:quinol monooxygenase YgiN
MSVARAPKEESIVSVHEEANLPPAGSGEIVVVAKITVKEGKGKEYEAIVRDLIETVRAKEPGCRLYTLHLSRSEPNTYCWVERYVDTEAFEAHISSDYFKKMRSRVEPFVSNREILTLKRIA